jgi:hypothetical protein
MMALNCALPRIALKAAAAADSAAAGGNSCAASCSGAFPAAQDSLPAASAAALPRHIRSTCLAQIESVTQYWYSALLHVVG